MSMACRSAISTACEAAAQTRSIPAWPMDPSASISLPSRVGALTAWAGSGGPPAVTSTICNCAALEPISSTPSLTGAMYPFHGALAVAPLIRRAVAVEPVLHLLLVVELFVLQAHDVVARTVAGLYQFVQFDQDGLGFTVCGVLEKEQQEHAQQRPGRVHERLPAVRKAGDDPTNNQYGE